MSLASQSPSKPHFQCPPGPEDSCGHEERGKIKKKEHTQALHPRLKEQNWSLSCVRFRRPGIGEAGCPLGLAGELLGPDSQAHPGS